MILLIAAITVTSACTDSNPEVRYLRFKPPAKDLKDSNQPLVTDTSIDETLVNQNGYKMEVTVSKEDKGSIKKSTKGYGLILNHKYE